MKRSAALAPLSRDHHLALVIARALCRAEPDDADACAERFLRFIEEHELAHFAQEESVLLPAVPDDASGRALTRRLLEDHGYLREAARRLRDAPAGISLEFVHEVGARLRDHVQMEEREFFPYLERSLDVAALDEIGARLTRSA